MSPGNGPEDGGILPRLVRGGAGGKRQCVPVRAIGSERASEDTFGDLLRSRARSLIGWLFGPAKRNFKLF